MATQKELAVWLGVSDRQIRNLETSNVLPGKKARSGYDIQECVLAYIRYLQKNQKKGGAFVVPGEDYDPQNPEESGGINLASEDNRYAKLRNDKMELQINELARKLAPIELLQDFASKLTNAVAAVLDSIPGQVKRRNPKITSDDLMIIKKEIAKAMNAASRTEIQLDDYQGLSEID